MTTFRLSLFSCLAFSAGFFASLPVSAATYTWDGGSTVNALWTSADNWDATPAFDNTADIILYAVGNTRFDSAIGTDRTIRSITFSADADTTFRIRPEKSNTRPCPTSKPAICHRVYRV